MLLSGKGEKKEGGRRKREGKRGRTRVDLSLLNIFTRRSEEIFNVVACPVRSREEMLHLRAGLLPSATCFS